MRILMSVLSAVALLAVPVGAQVAAPVATQSTTTLVVEGRVLDAETHAPIAGAAMSAGEARTNTDVDGGFSLSVPAGRATVEVLAAGYFPFTTTLDVGEAGLPGVELSLARDTAFATSVEVVASAPGAAPACRRYSRAARPS